MNQKTNKLLTIITILFLSSSLSAQEPPAPTPTPELWDKPKLSPTTKPTKITDVISLMKGKSPSEVVQLFVSMDLSGDRIAKQHEEMFKLTNWAKPLDWDLYMVVDKWGLVKEEIKDDKAVVTVQFELEGRVVKNEYLILEPETETEEILLLQNKRKKIWEIVSLQFAPHVSRKALPSNIKEISIEPGTAGTKRTGGSGAHE